MKDMISKYPGTCCQCSKPIAKGTRIKWSRQRGAFCTSCAYPETRQHVQRGPDLTDMLYEDQCAAACGFGL